MEYNISYKRVILLIAIVALLFFGAMYTANDQNIVKSNISEELKKIIVFENYTSTYPRYDYRDANVTLEGEYEI